MRGEVVGPEVLQRPLAGAADGGAGGGDDDGFGHVDHPSPEPCRPRLAGSGRAPRLRVPDALGRPSSATRQQRHLRRLPPGGPGGPPAPPRHVTRRPARARAWSWCDTVVDYLAPLRLPHAPVCVEVWVTEVRAASFTLGYEVFTEAGDEPVVHGRATTVLTPYVFATERPRRMTAEERERLLESPRPAPVVRPSRPAAADGLGRHGVVERPVHVRFSDVDLLGHVNNVRYFEYTQIAQVDLLVGVFREATRQRHRHARGRAQRDRLRRPDNLRPEPYAVRSRVVGRRRPVGRRSSRRSATRERAG